ncbi:MAG TPA: glycosyltransferase family 39 protein, partial [Candidatus Binataceae bacterium]
TNGLPRGEKPAPYYWFIIASSHFSGGVNETSSRMPSAIFAVMLVLLTFVFARQVMSPASSFVSALVLATSCRFAWQARWAEPDVVLSFFVTLAMYLFYRALRVEAHRRFACIAGYTAAVAASLIKGPVGLAVPAVSLFAYIATGGREWRGAVKRLMPGWGILITLAILLPFYWAVGAAAGSGYLRDLIIHQNFTRFVRAFDHRQPIYYYFYIFTVDFMPFSMFAFAGVVYSLKESYSERRGDIRFFLCWFLAGMVFFSLSGSKREVYLLPLYPAAAILAGVLLERWRTGAKLSWWYCEFPAWFTCAILAAAAVVSLRLVIDPSGVARKSYDAITATGFRPAEIANLASPLIALAAVVVGAAIWLLARQRRLAFQLCLAAFSASVMLYVQTAILPAVNPYKSARTIGARLAELLPEHSRFGGYSPEATAPWVDRIFLWDGYLFYSQRLMVPIDNRHDLAKHLDANDAIVVLMKRDDYEKLPQSIKANIRGTEGFRVGHKEMLLISNKSLDRATK